MGKEAGRERSRHAPEREILLRCCVSNIDSEMQPQLFNLNPDITGHVGMRLDNLVFHMLYPTSSNLGSLFFLTQYVSLLIFQ